MLVIRRLLQRFGNLFPKGKYQDLFSYELIILICGTIFFFYIMIAIILQNEKNSELLISSPIKKAVIYPSREQINELEKLYSSAENKLENSKNSRFRIRKTLPDDELLLAAPRAKSTVRIVGILASTNPASSLVIIENAGKQQSYSQHDRIAQRLAIIKIFPDRVIVNEDGFYAALILDDKFS